MGSEIDSLAEASHSVQNKTGEQALWKTVMGLGSWFFIARGEGEDVEPMVAAVEGRPQLLAFTEEERAEAFARHIEGKRGGPRPAVLDMDVPDAVEYAKVLEGLKVESILFNSGAYAFSCSMTRLGELWGRYGPRG